MFDDRYVNVTASGHMSDRAEVTFHNLGLVPLFPKMTENMAVRSKPEHPQLEARSLDLVCARSQSTEHSVNRSQEKDIKTVSGQ